MFCDGFEMVVARLGGLVGLGCISDVSRVGWFRDCELMNLKEMVFNCSQMILGRRARGPGHGFEMVWRCVTVHGVGVQQ